MTNTTHNNIVQAIEFIAICCFRAARSRANDTSGAELGGLSPPG
jgi:hypothetical protein